MLPVGTGNGRVHLVDADTGTVRWEMQPYPGNSIVRVAMSPDGRLVASVTAAEEGWKLWDTASGVEWMSGARHGTGACMCRVTSSGRRLDEGCPVRAHTSGLVEVAFSPCGKRLATGGNDSAVILWDAQTGNGEHIMQEHADQIRSLSFSADGVLLASASHTSICVWEVATGALLRGWKCVRFSPRDNNRLATASGSALLQWDVESGEKLCTFTGFFSCEFSPNGRTIATHSARGVHLIEAESGILRLRLDCHQDFIHSVSFSVDGSKLATGGHDGSCKVWDSSTGERLHTFDLQTEIYAVSWGRDWVLDVQRGVAFATGNHPRLGEESQVLALEEGVLRMILDRV